MKILLAESDYARRLYSDRRELLEYSKGLGGLAERRAARTEFLADMKAAGRIMLAPKSGEDPKNLYRLDASGVAHIPIIGQLTPVAQQDVCGGYTAEALTEYGYIVAATEAANADPGVKSIDYHIDSPGGYVSGVESAAQAMAASSVPTRAIVGDMAASAAYWLASQTDSIVASSPASRVGSIGVLAEEFDPDRALVADGIDHRVYTSTDAPMKHADTKTPEGRAQVVAELDAIHEVFRARVAEGRGVSIEKVNSDFGRGSVMTATAALAAGMIDEIQGQSIGRKTSKSAVGAQAEKAIKVKGHHMTPEELKAANPEAYQAAHAEGMADGIKAEQKRVADLAAWKGMNADVDKVVEEATAQGKTFADVQAQLSAAAARGPKQLAGANPPAAATAESTASGATEAVEGLSDVDVAQLKAAGMTIEQIRANAPKGGR